VFISTRPSLAFSEFDATLSLVHTNERDIDYQLIKQLANKMGVISGLSDKFVIKSD